MAVAEVSEPLRNLALLPDVATASQPASQPAPQPTSSGSDITAGVAETIVGELVTPDGPHDLHQVLQRFGYTAAVTHQPSVTSFLASTLQAHRILSHAPSPAPTKDVPSPAASADDERISTALSQMLEDLNTPPAHVPTDYDVCADILVSAVQSISNAVQKLISAHADKSISMPQPAISAADRSLIISDPRRKVLCEDIATALHKEHVSRVGVLLTRLKVTAHALSRSDKAFIDGDPHSISSSFSRLQRRADEVQGQWHHPPPITVYQTFMAPHYALAEALGLRKMLLRSESSQKQPSVKQLLMGDVPDRGGRLDRAAEMPAFRIRQTDGQGNTAKESDRGGRRRGGGGRQNRGGKRRNRY